MTTACLTAATDGGACYPVQAGLHPHAVFRRAAGAFLPRQRPPAAIVSRFSLSFGRVADGVALARAAAGCGRAHRRRAGREPVRRGCPLRPFLLR